MQFFKFYSSNVDFFISSQVQLKEFNHNRKNKNIVINLIYLYIFFYPPYDFIGLWCLYLHLLCTGDGDKDGGSGDFWSSLLPGRHLEPAGLFHRHGWVSNCFMSAWALILNYHMLLQWLNCKSAKLSSFTHYVTGRIIYRIIMCK